jgi:hypothetical protein
VAFFFAVGILFPQKLSDEGTSLTLWIESGQDRDFVGGRSGAGRRGFWISFDNRFK